MEEMRTVIKKALLLILMVLPGLAQAAVVLDYENNQRQWGTSNVVNILTVVTNGGHTVNSGPIASLAVVDVLLLGEPLVTPTGGEISSIQNFVMNGGTLLVFTDSSCEGCTASNAVLSGIGSSIQISTTTDFNSPAPLASTSFTTSPRNIAGQSLILTPGQQVNGGSALAGDSTAYEQLGAGLIVVFGDRSDFDGANPSDGSSVNSQLILNLLDNASAPGGGGDGIPVPTLSPWGLAVFVLVLGLLGAGWLRRRTHAQH